MTKQSDFWDFLFPELKGKKPVLKCVRAEPGLTVPRTYPARIKRVTYRRVVAKGTRTPLDRRLITIRKKAKERKDRRMVTGDFVPLLCVQCIPHVWIDNEHWDCRSMDWARECEDKMKNGNQFCFDHVYRRFSPRFNVCYDIYNHCQGKEDLADI